MAIHVVYAVVLVICVFPIVSATIRVRIERKWNNSLISILNIRISMAGAVPDLSSRNFMLVANHVSWLDIYVLNAIRPVRFISKIEVLSWPVVGWLARQTGTFFIDRRKRHDTSRINHEVSELLDNGGCVAVFPEGTTSNGTLLRRFHTALLEPAVLSRSRVWPAAIRYLHADGSLNITPAYIDDLSFADSLKLIISQDEIFVDVQFMTPIEAGGKVRRELAHEAQDAIAAALRLQVEPEITVKYA